MRFLLTIITSLGFLFSVATGQEYSPSQISEIVKDFKANDRGPYKDIKWFCEDGTIRDARDPCPDDMEGFQHARYSDITDKLHSNNKLYFGKILIGSEKAEFWNWEEDHDPIKQYMLIKYLEDIDNGWIRQKAQFYRGSIQSEDELEWSKEFFRWVLNSDTRSSDNYLLIRQAAKVIPHQSETQVGNKVRILSKVISDKYSPFMALRTKIHSTPEPSDIQSVIEFQEANKTKMSSAQNEEMSQLIAEMNEMFKPIDIQDLSPHVDKLSAGELRSRMEEFIGDFSNNDRNQRFERASELLLFIRQNFLDQKNGEQRLAALDLSIILEKMINNDLQGAEKSRIYDLVDMLCYLNSAIVGAGYIELWENDMSDSQAMPSGSSVYTHELNRLVDHHRRIAEWSATNMTVLFSDVVEKYLEFEPLAKSFIDDQIRSTILLNYGKILSELAEERNKFSNVQNDVLGIDNQERIRGLNPGYAQGILEVIETVDENLNIDKNKIYVFKYPPSDLGPIKGIMTVNEGNVVSHVQLLARNLGIPNAVISEENMKSFKKFDGKPIFYAVSLSGDVIMKKADDMNEEERNLFKSEERVVTSITVDTDRIDLDRDTVVNMRLLSGKDSGISCGPKAANLAQLKRIFPENVVEGVVIPFGVYKKHMDQKMQTRNMTYWQFINQIFKDKADMIEDGMQESEVECIVEGELGILRENIYNINISDEFKNDFALQFKAAFGDRLGNVPVFLRSDTNMEDLKEFTGAGLNLTKFNILNSDEIYQGIREVWASPFTERSYKWRQSYLNNPENVYPSILVIPSVNVDYSGVIITKDINNGSDEGMTIAFSRGVGGAVDGQRAETYIIRDNKYYELISPSRETKYRTIPPSGGSKIETAQFSEPILSYKNMNDLIGIVDTAKEEIPNNTDMEGPYDIELGFKDNKIWLFQIRPFVENKTANSSDYLQSISSTTSSDKVVNLNQNL